MRPIEGGKILAIKLNNSNLAGVLLFIGGLQWLMTVMAAETLFPGYSTGEMISAIWHQRFLQIYRWSAPGKSVPERQGASA